MAVLPCPVHEVSEGEHELGSLERRFTDWPDDGRFASNNIDPAVERAEDVMIALAGENVW
jgi:hypothetical protein